MRSRGFLLLAGLLAAGPACKTAAAPVTGSARGARPQLDVERLTLRVSPLEIAASGVRGQAESEELVSIKNVSDHPMVIMRIGLAGEGTSVFHLVGAPAVSRTLMPGQGLDVSVRFAPPAEAEPGVHRCTVQIHLGPEDDLGPLVDVAGLVTKGEGPTEEPPLAEVAAALGFAIEVGSASLVMPATHVLQGDEVSAPYFVRAKPGAIAVDPVARYSAAVGATYGIYRLADSRPALETLGGFSAEPHQCLHPEWAGDGKLSFDPGPEPFGMFVKGSPQPLHSEARLNQSAAHAARVYPLRARNGEAIADAYLVAFEQAPPVDYQDYVFVLWNVRPAGP